MRDGSTNVYFPLHKIDIIFNFIHDFLRSAKLSSKAILLLSMHANVYNEAKPRFFFTSFIIHTWKCYKIKVSTRQHFIPHTRNVYMVHCPENTQSDSNTHTFSFIVFIAVIKHLPNEDEQKKHEPETSFALIILCFPYIFVNSKTSITTWIIEFKRKMSCGFVAWANEVRARLLVSSVLLLYAAYIYFNTQQ